MNTEYITETDRRIKVVVPARCMKEVTLISLQTRDIRPFPLIQKAGSRDQHVSFVLNNERFMMV
jgi:hypothetical protein